MVRKHDTLARLFLVATACALIFNPARLALAGWLDGVKEMKVGEKTVPVCPDAEFFKAGFPARKVPDDRNAAIEYIKAINLYVEPPRELNDLYQYVMGNVWIDEADKLLPWLEKNAAAIAAVREGAKKEDCKFPFFGKPGSRLFDFLLPQLQYMRKLARLLNVQGKYLERQKKYREALDTYLVGARMGYHVSRGPFLISGLVGIACDAISAKAIERCVLRNRLDTATLTYLLERLDDVGRSAESYEIVMSGERALGPAMVDEFPVSVGWPLGFRALMKSDIRRYWNRMDEWIKLPDHIALRPENRVDKKIIEEMPRWSLARTLVPGLSRARVSFVRTKAIKAILTAQIALEIYRNKKRNYPDKLDQLKGIPGEIPVDPFTNEPLKYRRTEDGYLVYSVNDNLVDDGGAGRSPGAKDIVGRCPLPEPEPFKPSE